MIPQLRAALVFYTCLPLSGSAPLNFRGVAAWAPLVGCLIGSMLGGSDWLLGILGCGILLRSAGVVLLGVLLTGGLHLDGAMDTADGLAATGDRDRLTVMSDSRTGAFGVMAAVAILLLKTIALAAIPRDRMWTCVAVAAWGRWGQLRAIAAYEYLKPEGKGKFHREDVRGVHVWANGLVLVGGNLILGWFFHRSDYAIAIVLAGGIAAWGIAAWLNAKLGGQTGDTYGAVVEWTETILLCVLGAIDLKKLSNSIWFLPEIFTFFR